MTVTTTQENEVSISSIRPGYRGRLRVVTVRVPNAASILAWELIHKCPSSIFSRFRLKSITFQSSSFFLHHTVLPTPDEVRHAAGTAGKFDPPASVQVDSWRWAVVRFPSLGLIVKYGRQITIAGPMWGYAYSPGK
jgi:hypothetical protein